MRMYYNAFFAQGESAEEYMALHAHRIMDTLDSSGVDLFSDDCEHSNLPFHGTLDVIETIEYRGEIFIIGKHFGVPYVSVTRIKNI